MAATGASDASSADAVFAAAEKAFSGWERRAIPEEKRIELPALKGRTLVFVQRPNSVQSSISVGNFTPQRDDQRWYTLQLANQIFGAAFDSRLVRNIREEKGYTYSPQSVFQSMGQGGLYRAVADVRNEVTGATLKEIYAEIMASLGIRSMDELIAAIMAFIEEWNRSEAHPFRWTYDGRPLVGSRRR